MAFDLIDELDRIVAALDQHAVEYALAGWLASAVHRWPASPDTTELFVAESSLLRALTAVASVGFVSSTTRSDRRDSYRVLKAHLQTSEHLSLDLRVVTSGLAHVWSRRVRAIWREREVTVLSREGLAIDWPSHVAIPAAPATTGPVTTGVKPIDLSDEAITQRMETVRALYLLSRSLRSAKVLGPAEPR